MNRRSLRSGRDDKGEGGDLTEDAFLGRDDKDHGKVATSPEGTADLSPGRSPGLDLEGRPVPEGRLKFGGGSILDILQPSLRDLVMLHDVPRTASWAKVNHPFGTEFAHEPKRPPLQNRWFFSGCLRPPESVRLLIA
jgi:hypothetical protein